MSAGAWDGLWAEAKRVDIVDLARRLGGRLNKSGGHWIGPCPLGCARKDGFVVNPDKGFLCRPSGARGDAVDMVKHVKGYDDIADALEFITGKRPPRKERGTTLNRKNRLRHRRRRLGRRGKRTLRLTPPPPPTR
jgi:hypothetical protein